MYISRRRKCAACKDLLIDRENTPSLGDVFEVKDLLLAMADRGGLFAPKHCYFCFRNQIYSKLRSNDSIRKQFLCLNNRRVAFVSALTEVVKENADQHEFLLNQICNEGHCNFKAILQSLFSCFTKNELKRVNQCDEPRAKMSRGVRKLISKSTPMH